MLKTNDPWQPIGRAGDWLYDHCLKITGAYILIAAVFAVAAGNVEVFAIFMIVYVQVGIMGTVVWMHAINKDPSPVRQVK